MRRRLIQPPATQAGLPYGIVMATGGTSQLAHACGLSTASNLLLGLAVAQAIWILLLGVLRHRHRFMQLSKAWLAVNPPEQHVGGLTVPLGLAVIEAGLATRFGSYTISPITAAGLILVWLATLLCISRFVISLCTTPSRLYVVAGAWFLAPAVLLGAAVATADALPPTGAGFYWLMAELAGLAAIAGLAGYWAVLVAGCIRVIKYRLADTPHSHWWIVMGCAGLAAAALASVTQINAVIWLATWKKPLEVLMVVTFATAIVLLIPVVGLSIEFVWRRCRFEKRASWPPTFSTAVFAMGGLGLGVTLQSTAATTLGTAAAWTTFVLWVVSMVWNIWVDARNAVRSAVRNHY